MTRKMISISKWAAAVLAILLPGPLATFAQVNLPLGNLAPGESVTITFDVTITSPFPPGVNSVTNHGTLSGSNFSAVNSDDPQTVPVGDATITAVDIPLTAVTLAPSAIKPTAATLNGFVTPDGPTTFAWFQVGLTTNYDSATDTNSIGAGTNAVPVNALLTNLNLRTLYHYRVVATNSGSSSFGADQAFTIVEISAPQLTSPKISNGVFQFGFTNTSGLALSLFAATNLALPFSNWTLVTTPTEGPPGVYQVTDPQSASNGQRFYRVRWP